MASFSHSIGSFVALFVFLIHLTNASWPWYAVKTELAVDANKKATLTITYMDDTNMPKTREEVVAVGDTFEMAEDASGKPPVKWTFEGPNPDDPKKVNFKRMKLRKVFTPDKITAYLNIPPHFVKVDSNKGISLKRVAFEGDEGYLKENIEIDFYFLYRTKWRRTLNMPIDGCTKCESHSNGIVVFDEAPYPDAPKKYAFIGMEGEDVSADASAGREATETRAVFRHVYGSDGAIHRVKETEIKKTEEELTRDLKDGTYGVVHDHAGAVAQSSAHREHVNYYAASGDWKTDSAQLEFRDMLNKMYEKGYQNGYREGRSNKPYHHIRRKSSYYSN